MPAAFIPNHEMPSLTTASTGRHQSQHIQRLGGTAPPGLLGAAEPNTNERHGHTITAPTRAVMVPYPRVSAPQPSDGIRGSYRTDDRCPLGTGRCQTAMAQRSRAATSFPECFSWQLKCAGVAVAVSLATRHASTAVEARWGRRVSTAAGLASQRIRPAVAGATAGYEIARMRGRGSSCGGLRAGDVPASTPAPVHPRRAAVLDGRALVHQSTRQSPVSDQAVYRPGAGF